MVNYFGTAKVRVDNAGTTWIGILIVPLGEGVEQPILQHSAASREYPGAAYCIDSF